jgi:hypothetical protein
MQIPVCGCRKLSQRRRIKMIKCLVVLFLLVTTTSNLRAESLKVMNYNQKNNISKKKSDNLDKFEINNRELIQLSGFNSKIKLKKLLKINIEKIQLLAKAL